MQLKKLKNKEEISLGTHSFSAEEIIKFAKINDPLPFHLSKKAAMKSRFKGLVTSGSQAFNFFYVHAWVPKFGQTVISGLALNDWEFLSPIYEEETINGFCALEQIKTTSQTNEVVIDWFFSFINENNQLKQKLTLKILHQIEN